MQIFKNDEVRDESHLRRDEKCQQQGSEKYITPFEFDNRKTECSHCTSQQLTDGNQDGNIGAVPKEQREVEIHREEFAEIIECKCRWNERLGKLVARQFKGSGNH